MIKHAVLTVLLLSAVLLSAETSPAGKTYPVRASLLYLRTSPGADSPVITLLRQGTLLTVVAEKDAWCEVVVPPEVPVWVSRVSVRENSLKEDARFRTGPGVMYEACRTSGVPKGPFRMLGSARNGAWIRIQAYPCIRGFVKSEYLLPDREPAGEPAPKAPSRFSRPVSLEGTLRKLKKSVDEAQYELFLEINGSAYPLFYVTSDSLNLSLWNGRNIRIEGTRTWKDGIRIPFVRAEKISPSWQ